MLLFSLLLAQAAQATAVDSILPKLLEYGVAGLAVYALITVLKNTDKQDSEQNATLQESIKLNGRVVDMLGEFKTARQEDNLKFQQALENITKNESSLHDAATKNTAAMDNVAAEVKVNTQVTIDYYKAASSRTNMLVRGLVQAQRHFDVEVESIKQQLQQVNNNHIAVLTAVAELRGRVKPDTQPMLPIDTSGDTPPEAPQTIPN